VTAGLHFCRRWETGLLPAVPDCRGVELREVRTSEITDIGRVMWSAFRGSPDEFETVADAETEVLQTLEGKWGPFVADASSVAVISDEIVSSALVVLDDAHHRIPLLAYTATAPEWQGQGLASALIENAVRRLDALGVTELHLSVLPGNPAPRLYERLGFELISGP
jgi:ribosomal protein S18 acetylase RimI-like enzyme